MELGRSRTPLGRRSCGTLEAVYVAEDPLRVAAQQGGEISTLPAGEWVDIMDNHVNHPKHYNSISGVECIDIVEQFNFNRGNAIKYIWRAGLKGDEIEDLEKALWYIQREIDRVKRSSHVP